MNDPQPHIYYVRKSAGIAGQFAVNARVGYPPDEAPRDIAFTGSVLRRASPDAHRQRRGLCL